jgi:ribosomal small subunit protein bTHX
MGKGDNKSRKAKIWKGTYGVRRRRKKIKSKVIPNIQQESVVKSA